MARRQKKNNKKTTKINSSNDAKIDIMDYHKFLSLRFSSNLLADMIDDCVMRSLLIYIFH